MPANHYECMTHFQTDFPKAKSVRVAQIGAYNCLVDRICVQRQLSCSIFLPTGTGKSDVIRMAAIGLTKRKCVAGAFVFSPSTDLKTQLKVDEVTEFFDRVGYDAGRYHPFMELDRLDGDRFRDGCVLESYTVQYLTTNGNVNLFIKHAEILKKKKGVYPIAIFDESHLYSTENQWGGAAQKMQSIGIPIVLITGTPFRSDNIVIPGFKTELVDTFQKKFVKTEETDDPMVIKVRKGNQQVCRYSLKADYEYSYQRAWEDGIILKPQPRFADATHVAYQKAVSEMSSTESNRLLRTFLMDDLTISASVADCIQSLRVFKSADPRAAAIVTTLSDQNEFEISESDAPDHFADLHAKKIELEFRKQSPDLKVLVVTSKTNSDGLSRFKKNDYDVLIVKAMGTIGFNCRKIKVVLNLSNFRTLPAFIQLINRGCRPFASISTYDVIMPKDKGMVALWNQFMDQTGLIIETKETIDETEEDKNRGQGDDDDGDEDEGDAFENHDFSIDPIAKRGEAEEIIEMFRKKCPILATKMTNQEILGHFEMMANVHGKDWLSRLPDKYVKPPVLIDINEEETRLRSEANGLVKEITMGIIRDAMGCEYDAAIYGQVLKSVWTCLKRRCGFRPNQSLGNLSGIENYKKIKAAGELLKESIHKLPSTSDFDYEAFLRKF